MHKVDSFQAIDQLLIIQKELQTCVQDVDKTKKLYFDEEHSAHDVRDKAKDIEEKYVHRFSTYSKRSDTVDTTLDGRYHWLARGSTFFLNKAAFVSHFSMEAIGTRIRSTYTRFSLFSRRIKFSYIATLTPRTLAFSLFRPPS